MNILYVVLASIGFGVFPSIENVLLQHGDTPLAVSLVCMAVAGIIAFFCCLFGQKGLRVTKKNLLDLSLIGMIGFFFTDYLLAVAYTMIPVGFVTMIHFVYPVLVCIIMALFFKERLNGFKVIAIICAVSGLYMLTGESFSGSMWGVFIAFLTALFYAYYMIGSDRSSISTVAVWGRVFYTCFFAVVMGFCFGLATGTELIFPATIYDWLTGAAAGTVFCLSIYFLNKGICGLGASEASFINMLEPITSLLVSAAVYGYTITLSAWIGCGLIVSSLFFASYTGIGVQTEEQVRKNGNKKSSPQL